MKKMIKYYDTYREAKGGTFLDAITSWHAWDKENTTVRMGEDFVRIGMPMNLFEERLAVFAGDEAAEVWDIRPQPKPQPVAAEKPKKGLMSHFRHS